MHFDGEEIMDRRSFVLGGIVGFGLLQPAFAQSNPLTVIYIGGQDCPSCAQWKGQYKAKWEASPEFKKVKWVAVDPPRFSRPTSPRTGPMTRSRSWRSFRSNRALRALSWS